MSRCSCLAGTCDKGVVEVSNCFCVPHKEHADQVEAELNYAMDVYELNRRVNAAESIVGQCHKVPVVAFAASQFYIHLNGIRLGWSCFECSLNLGLGVKLGVSFYLVTVSGRVVGDRQRGDEPLVGDPRVLRARVPRAGPRDAGHGACRRAHGAAGLRLRAARRAAREAGLHVHTHSR